jgi:hypothetical protein
MTTNQKRVIKALLNKSIEYGFGSGYSLKEIADELGISEVLYDNETNTGILWEFGPYGHGYIYAHGDWPNSYASISYDFAQILENWTYGA